MVLICVGKWRVLLNLDEYSLIPIFLGLITFYGCLDVFLLLLFELLWYILIWMLGNVMPISIELSN